jgi:hypothetical protein
MIDRQYHEAHTPEGKLVQRIKMARSDRDTVASALNRFYELALPFRVPISSTVSRNTQTRMEEQEDVFDDTLQACTLDFGAEMMDRFTPHYKPWANLKPTTQLGDALAKKAEGMIRDRERLIYEAIKNSDFYEQSQQAWLDLAGSKGGIIIPYSKSGNIKCTPIVMSNLLDDIGPHGQLDLRAMEFLTKKKHLQHLFPKIKMEPHLRDMGIGENQDVVVVQGNYRLYDGPFDWMFFVSIQGKVVQMKKQKGMGACAVHTLRWSDAPFSSWGPGPAMTAMPSANVLQELGYLFLKNLGKRVDPPFSYYEDGLFNPEGGIDAGMALPRDRNSGEVQWLIAEQDLDTALFEREQFRLAVKRALFQDKPDQTGKTPPTATQWIDERAMTERRLQLSRLRVYKEWVLPILDRFNHILTIRGDLPPLSIDGEIIDVSFENPITKTSDAEEVSASMQLAQAAAGIFGEAFLANTDAVKTLENWKQKSGDKLLEFKPFDEQPEGLQGLLSNMRNLSNKA